MCRTSLVILLLGMGGFSGIVGADTITVTYPNGGERLGYHWLKDVEWQSTGMIEQVRIEYSVNNGASWNLVVDNYVNSGIYKWTIPETRSDECRVRISDASDPLTNDTSNGVFTIFSMWVQHPTVETVLAGSNLLIEWQVDPETSHVLIEYTDNWELSWNVIEASHPNTGSYVWTTPIIHSTGCRIRITDVATPYDHNVSAGYCAIKKLILDGPNYGEVLLAGSEYTVTWRHEHTVDNVNLEFHDGEAWSTIAGGIYNSGYYVWVPPITHSRYCRLRISNALDSDVEDQSSGFAVLKLIVTSPNGGEFWTSGELRNLEWQYETTISQVTLEYSTDNGLTWHDLEPWGTENDGWYDWEVQTRSSDESLIRICDQADPEVCDTSDQVYQSRAALDIIAPNGGESFQAGIEEHIVWETIGYIDDVVVEYSADGFSWITVHPPNAGNSNSYDWIVPEITWENWRVRVRDPNYPDVADTSDGVFTIYECLLQDPYWLIFNGAPISLCEIDLGDLWMLAFQWLSETQKLDIDSPWPQLESDLNDDQCVDLGDFALLAANWKDCGNPLDPSCDVPGPWPQCWDWPTQCEGDADGDGYIGPNDYVLVQEAFASLYGDPRYNPCTDFNQDGIIDTIDVYHLYPLGRWAPGACSGTPAAPWPMGPYQDCTTDNDGDGYGYPANPTCGHRLADCDDGNPTIYPGAYEACWAGRDFDCDGLYCNDPECPCVDQDQDGYGNPANECCPQAAWDCNDNDPCVPGEAEICDNGIDDDCNGYIDCDDPCCCAGPLCPPDATPPSPPSGLTATGEYERVLLDWDQNSEPDFSHCILYVSDDPCNPCLDFEATGNIPKPYSSAFHTNLVNGVEYCYYLTAVDTCGNESDPSIIITATPMPLIARWSLDDPCSSTIAQDSVGGKDGEVQNPHWTIGYLNGALEFDGIETYVQTEFEALKTLDSFTVTCWFKAHTTAGVHHLIWQGYPAANGWGNSGEFHISIGHPQAEGVISLFYGRARDESVDIIAPFDDTSAWRHLAAVIDNAGSAPSGELYLDGLPVGSDMGSATDRSDWYENLRLGAAGQLQLLFDGILDDVRIYDAALTPEQIADLLEP